MMQKYQLKQDLFLVSPCCPHQACFCSPRIRLLIPAVLVMSQIGPPGPERRRLAMRFAEVLQLEVEYLAITRDTTGRANLSNYDISLIETNFKSPIASHAIHGDVRVLYVIEADLKQRREIINGSVVYVDQAPVRAALHGRVLIVDGIEKAERNVLPTLNNLLENREMALEDGRFLVHTERYDNLQHQPNSGSDSTLASATAIKGEQVALVRVHPNFRVIALGLPVPRFPGYLLDPPLRSRFQALSVGPVSLESKLNSVAAVLSRNSNSNSTSLSDAHMQAARSLVSLREALSLLQRQTPKFAARMPFFSDSAVDHVAAVLTAFGPELLDSQLIARGFPYRFTCDDTQRKVVEAALARFAIPITGTGPESTSSSAAPATTASQGKALSRLSFLEAAPALPVPAGPQRPVPILSVRDIKPEGASYRVLMQQVYSQPPSAGAAGGIMSTASAVTLREVLVSGGQSSNADHGQAGAQSAFVPTVRLRQQLAALIQDHVVGR